MSLSLWRSARVVEAVSFWLYRRLKSQRSLQVLASGFRRFRRLCSRAAFGFSRGKLGFSGAVFWLLRFRRFCSHSAFGFCVAKRFCVAASTCGRNDFSASCLTSPQQIAAPDRKKRYSIRLLTASLVAPLFAAGELSVLPKRAASLKLAVLVVLPFVLSSSSPMFCVDVLAARRFCSRAAFGLLRFGRGFSRAAFGFGVVNVSSLVQVLAGATIAAQSV